MTLNEIKISNDSSYKVYGLSTKDNPDLIRYIGITKNNLNVRLTKHKNDAKTLIKNKHKKYWILKHWDNIVITPIEEGIKTINEANTREIYWIKYYKDKSFNLLNVTNGGDGTVGYSNKKAWVKVNQFDLEGNLIKTWDSCTEARRFLNIKSSSNIIECCKGRLSRVKGYVWRYENDSFNKFKLKTRGDKLQKPIYQIEPITGEVVNKFISTKEAALFLNIKSKGNISLCLNNKRDIAFGYKWRFVK